MNMIKLENSEGIPEDYTGIVEWDNGVKEWFKNGEHHREDGPAFIRNYGNYKSWYLDGKCIWYLNRKLDLTNQIILSKSQHPEYPLVQVWRILDKDRVYEQIVIPGMEESITE